MIIITMREMSFTQSKQKYKEFCVNYQLLTKTAKNPAPLGEFEQVTADQELLS